MDHKIKYVVVVALAIFSCRLFATSADLRNQKTVTRIDFNQLIEEGNEKKQELTTTQAVEMEELAVQAEQKDVIKFIDVEVGIGKTPSVVGVDRRYNSVGEARILKTN